MRTPWPADDRDRRGVARSADGRSWFVLEGGPVGRIGEPHAIVVGDQLRFYLQPEDAVDWILWEGVPRE